METRFLQLPAELKAEESGYFTGYASTFGGDPDSYGDVIMRGAFSDTLLKGGYGGRGIKMLWQHDMRNPIGRWETIAEDSKGLRVVGKLAIKSTQGNDAYELMKIGALDGLSIGYDTLESEPGKGNIKRFLKKVELYEISPVTFAANPRASITQVKAAIESAQNERELEEALREGGLSKTSAQYIVAQCKHVLLAKNLSESNLEPAEEKPYPDEHACRLEDPSKFESFARKNNAAQVEGKRVDYIFGIQSGKTSLQAMRFPKSVWKADEARNYCKEKGGSFEAAKGQTIEHLIALLQAVQDVNKKVTNFK